MAKKKKQNINPKTWKVVGVVITLFVIVAAFFLVKSFVAKEEAVAGEAVAVKDLKIINPNYAKFIYTIEWRIPKERLGNDLTQDEVRLDMKDILSEAKMEITADKVSVVEDQKFVKGDYYTISWTFGSNIDLFRNKISPSLLKSLLIESISDTKMFFDGDSIVMKKNTW